jgi:solute carrier family 35, member C2
MDIGLSNASLKFITLAFYSTSPLAKAVLKYLALCKSSTLAFVLVFAFFFNLEKPGIKLIAVIATITVGVILMVATETEFVLTGYR